MRENNEKIISKVMVLLSFVLCFQNNIVLIQAAIDTNPPEVDEKEVTVGDRVKVSIRKNILL